MHDSFIERKLVDKKMARQTFVTMLQKATEDGLILRRESGKTTYYSLNANFPEDQTLATWLAFVKSRITYIPQDYLLS